MIKIVVMCNRCRQLHRYPCAQFQWEREAADNGFRAPEREHCATLAKTCSCGQTMIITFTCWEYPRGVENASDINITGADLLLNDCAACPDFPH